MSVRRQPLWPMLLAAIWSGGCGGGRALSSTDSAASRTTLGGFCQGPGPRLESDGTELSISSVEAGSLADEGASRGLVLMLGTHDTGPHLPVMLWVSHEGPLELSTPMELDAGLLPPGWILGVTAGLSCPLETCVAHGVADTGAGDPIQGWVQIDPTTDGNTRMTACIEARAGAEPAPPVGHIKLYGQAEL